MLSTSGISEPFSGFGKRVTFQIDSDARLIKKIGIGIKMEKIANLFAVFDVGNGIEDYNVLQCAILLNNGRDIIFTNMPLQNKMLEFTDNWENRADIFKKRASFRNSMVFINKPIVNNAVHYVVLNLDTELLSILRTTSGIIKRNFAIALRALRPTIYYEY